MKYLVAVLALAALVQAAEIPLESPTGKLIPRWQLFPRPRQAQGPGLIVPTEPAAPVDMRGFCGTRKVKNERIVGGVEAVPHEFPWQVAVTINAGSFCGGSLISPDWVMTAAHCADGALRFSLLLGAHDRTVSEPSQITINTNEYAIHPNWNPSTLANDIALIKLPYSLNFTDEISPICMAPTTEPDHAGDTLLVSGWGKTAEIGGISNTLNKVTAPGITTAECAATYGDIITDRILCIDTTGGHGSCNGDSGGPLSFDNNGVLNQVGIVSFGSSAGCTRGLPAGFTRVSSYAQWINLVTGIVF